MVSVETIAIGIYLAFVNVAAFFMYGADKRRAQRGERRIPEKTLLAIALLGGGLGAFLGMRIFHHKTRKLRFRLLVPLALVLTVIVGGGALYFSDYYRADDVALAAAASTDVVEVCELDSGELAFVPQGATVGLVFYPGAKVQAEAYAPLLMRCAERGVLCVLVRAPLNFALLDISAAREAVEQFPDIEHWVLAGHSLGGVAASEYLAGNPDASDALVLLAAYSASDVSSSDLRVLTIAGSADGVLNRAAYEEARGNLPAGSEEIVIEGGNHAHFGNYGEQRGDGTATISREEQQGQTADAIVALAGSL